MSSRINYIISDEKLERIEREWKDLVEFQGSNYGYIMLINSLIETIKDNSVQERS